MIKTHFKRVVVGCMMGLACAAAYWKSQPRIYEGSAQVFINSSSARETDAMSALLSLGVSQNPMTEGMILRSEGTFRQAVLNVAQRRGDSTLASPETVDALYLMYDVAMSPGSRLMTTMVRAYDPKVAADIANELVEVYNQKRKVSSTSAYTNAQFSVNEQLASTKKELDGSERRLTEFKQSLGGTDLNSKVNQITTYQATLQQQLDSARWEEDNLSKTIAATQAKIASLPKKIEVELSLVKSPVLSSIEMQIADLEKQRTQLLLLYTPTSAKVKELDEFIERTRARQLEAQKDIWQKSNRTFQLEPIRASFESQLAGDQIKLVSLKARERSLNKALSDQSALATALPTKEKQLADLSRDHDIFLSNYTRLKAQLTELQLQSASSFMPAVVLYPAEAVDKAISPVASKILPIGFMAGGILGLLFGFLKESMRSTVRSSDEIASLFELPVVATVPALTEPMIRRNLQSLTGHGHVPQESFRFMASAAALVQGGPRSVVFTSSGGNVGCSSAAGEFAVAAAKMGIRTILVDADTTFGTLTKVFKMKDKPGLRDFLGRRLLATEDVPLAIPTDHPLLSVVPIGGEEGVDISDTPNALLHGLIEGLQDQADLIVIDCPPIDVMADTSRFVPLASEVCLVVSARRTNLQSISLARALLERCGASTVSVVLTGATPKEEAFKGNNRYTAARR